MSSTDSKVRQLRFYVKRVKVRQLCSSAVSVPPGLKCTAIRPLNSGRIPILRWCEHTKKWESHQWTHLVNAVSTYNGSAKRCLLVNSI